MILDLELLTDVALTASGATATAHETLTYIPGQSLLGAVARDLYATAGEDAWRMFHSGDVRFGCGLPLSPDGSPSWPVPWSLHRPKGVVGGAVANLAHAEARDPGQQYTAIRDGYIDAHPRLWCPSKTRTMRTAIDAQGTARESYLFAISALTRGAHFRAEIGADDPALLDRVASYLDGTTIRVGRSRSAEFGAVRVRCRPEGTAHAPERSDFRAESRSVVFWCLSDLCLRDASTGTPTLLPSAADVGLPTGWRYEAGRSYVTTRRYSPWNGARRRPDLERSVIGAGSVLRFTTGGDALSEGAWAAVVDRLTRRVGEHRAEGLGWLVFEPRLLAAPAIGALPKGAAGPAPRPAEPRHDPLVAWMKKGAARSAAADTAWAHVTRLVTALADRGPKWHLPASQWGEVRRIARASAGDSAQALEVKLRAFAGVDKGSRASLERWGAKVRGEKLSDWLLKEVGGIEEESPVPALVVEMLATQAVRRQRREQETER